jgi:hypothetical protein
MKNAFDILIGYRLFRQKRGGPPKVEEVSSSIPAIQFFNEQRFCRIVF